MRPWIVLTTLFLVLPAHSDSIANYMNIANAIPKMEIKADSQSQAWARSARNVLTITSESIAETILQANALARKNGRPLFCPPDTFTLNATNMDAIIKQQYQSLQSQSSGGEKMSVSDIAWQGLIKQFPCSKSASAARIEHVAAILGH
ncbi:MAG: phosphatase [Legionellaceae bacterium]|nr:phosphatase [Legionellaceae bacterium]